MGMGQVTYQKLWHYHMTGGIREEPSSCTSYDLGYRLGNRGLTLHEEVIRYMVEQIKLSSGVVWLFDSSQPWTPS